MEPARLRLTGWLEPLGADIIAAGAPTCTTGVGRELDYAVVDKRILAGQAVVGARVLSLPVRPHRGFEIILKAGAKQHRVRTRRDIKRFPAHLPFGPRREPLGLMQLDPTLDFNGRFKEWIKEAEARLTRDNDFGIDDAPKFQGRVAGQVFTWQPSLGKAVGSA